MSRFEDMSDEYLRATYIPDVYQKTINGIAYEKLKKAGIKAISFDIDDTILPIQDHKLNPNDIIFFNNLKKKGFEIYLLSNANEKRVGRFAKQLKVDYISCAEKPDDAGFKAIMQMYETKHGSTITPNEMAHVGNNIIKDVGCGNSFGVVTCLVRSVGILPKVYRFIHETDGRKLRKVLLERRIWRKHHLKKKQIIIINFNY